MALQTSGQISLNDLHVEVGGVSGTECSLNDPDIRVLIGKEDGGSDHAITLYYGVSSEVELSSGTVINGQNSLQEITVSDYIGSGGTLIVPSGWWIWSDNTANAAMTIDIPCTITNNGKIIGKGGKGGWGNQNGQAGGPGIRINANVSGVTITNASGSYIAGGGGGGGGGDKLDDGKTKRAGGGGGAGGGSGGRPSGSNGGVLNATGGHIGGSSTVRSAWGGGAGGGGGHGHTNTLQSAGGALGGGGGRILPGIGGYYSGFSTNYNQNWSGNSNGHTTATGNSASGGAGGSAGGAGNNLGHSGAMYNGGGGGGGWGASGGRGGPSGNRSGGSGGKAIEDTGNTYTLTNNGTIYGATT